jgi:AbrB family looped-hinge helix DNA binding protein
MGEKCRFDIDRNMNYHFTMTITIDGAGRVVIPKKLREQLNLTEGSSLECELEDDAIRLKLAHSHCRLTTKNGILVAQGDDQNAATIDVVKLIKNQRNQRTEITS